MKLEERIILFSELGTCFKENIETEAFAEVLYTAKSKNGWFTIDNIKKAILNICDEFLDEKKIKNFIDLFPIEFFKPESPKNIGIIAAGNIPMVGFQDLMNVILCGHIALFKPSSQDEFLYHYVFTKLKEINPEIENYFKIVSRLNDADAFIATGSSNSSRYFEYYFSKKPHIIRKNRSSIAILMGNETKIELANLGNDIFEFFGLGCRNVSKLYVPKNYDFTHFFESIEYWNLIKMHSKYNNNYDYMKSIYLVNRVEHLDNGFLLLKEDIALSSPISVLFYEYYNRIGDINLDELENKIQVIVSNDKNIKNAKDFGQSQCPSLLDYADNIDVIAFLSSI